MRAETDAEIFEEWFQQVRTSESEDEWTFRRSGFDFALSLVSAEREQARFVAADLDETRSRLSAMHRRAQKAEAELAHVPQTVRAWASPDRQREAGQSDRMMATVAKTTARRRP